MKTARRRLGVTLDQIGATDNLAVCDMSSPYQVPLYGEDDYLGLAANAKHKANWRFEMGDFDEAWKAHMKQQRYYILHANKSGFTPEHTVSLVSTVNESLANILRLEGKHRDALVHMIYRVAGARSPSKRVLKKLPAYFNRAKLDNVSFSDVEELVLQQQPLADMRAIKNAVAGWLNQQV